MRIADLGLDPRVVDILKSQGIEELYPPQADAIGPALVGENVVLAIPTASGKSLAAEKFEDLKAFEPLGLKVGVSIGDYDSPDPSLEKLDVIVATSERTDSLLRHRLNWLQELTVVVADEVHLINDADRGPTLEVTLAKLRQVNPKAQVLALRGRLRRGAPEGGGGERRDVPRARRRGDRREDRRGRPPLRRRRGAAGARAEGVSGDEGGEGVT